MTTVSEPGKLRAVILAAGSKSITEDGTPVLLQDLGGKKIIDYVTANAAQVVAPADTYVVVGYRRDAIQAHLGPGYRYVVQEVTRGTGDAVRQLQPVLQDFDGDLGVEIQGASPCLRGPAAADHGRADGGGIVVVDAHEVGVDVVEAGLGREPEPVQGFPARVEEGRTVDLVDEGLVEGEDRQEIEEGIAVVPPRVHHVARGAEEEAVEGPGKAVEDLEDGRGIG